MCSNYDHLFPYRKFVNGAAGGDIDQIDGESRDVSPSEDGKLVSDLCKNVIGLELSSAIASSSTPNQSMIVSSVKNSSNQLAVSSNHLRGEQSDDEDTEVTVTTEIMKTHDDVNGSETKLSYSPRVSWDENKVALSSSAYPNKQSHSEDTVCGGDFVTKEQVLPGLSVNSSTDTLVAPDQLANPIISTIPSPAPPLWNGAR